MVHWMAWFKPIDLKFKYCQKILLMTFIYGLSCVIGQKKPQILNDYIMRKYRNKNVCEISVLIHPLTKLCLHVITRQITIDNIYR
jgi:hypothetical protein